MDILRFIPTGKENRLTTAALMNEAGFNDSADLRRAIATARKSGEPICNDGDGYYIAERPEEIERSIRRMGSRISKQIVAKKGLEKAARKLENELKN